MLRDLVSDVATDRWCTDWACVTPAPMTKTVQHSCEDNDGDAVLSEHHENLANTVGWCNTLLVQEISTTLIRRQVTVCLSIWERFGAL